MKPDIEYVYSFCCIYRLSVILNLFCQRFMLLATIVFIAATVFQICFALFPWTVLPVFWDMCFVGLFSGTGIIAFDLLILHKPALEKCALEIEQSAALSHPWVSLALELSHNSTPRSKELQLSVFEKAKQSLEKSPGKARLSYSFPKTIILLFSFSLFCASSFFCIWGL